MRDHRVCITCNPDYEPDEGEKVRYACEDCDLDDLDEFEDEHRRKLAERSEY